MNTKKPTFMKQTTVTVEDFVDEVQTAELPDSEQASDKSNAAKELEAKAQASASALDEILKAASTVTAKMQGSRPSGIATKKLKAGTAPDGYYSHAITYLRPKGGKPLVAQRINGRSYWPFTSSPAILEELSKAVEAGTVYVKGTPPQE